MDLTLVSGVRALSLSDVPWGRVDNNDFEKDFYQVGYKQLLSHTSLTQWNHIGEIQVDGQVYNLR